MDELEQMDFNVWIFWIFYAFAIMVCTEPKGPDGQSH